VSIAQARAFHARANAASPGSDDVAAPEPNYGRDAVVPRFEQIALAPMRASRRLLVDEAQKVVDQVLDSELPETVVRRVTPQIEETVNALLRSPEFRAALYEVMASVELRRALAEQRSGFASDAAAALRRSVARADAATDARIRPTLERDPETAGPWTRAAAFVVDLALAQFVFLTLAASVALLAAAVAPLRQLSIELALGGAGWLVVETVYFAGFWSVVGQTPGMRLFALGFPERLSAVRAVVRFAALLVAILPFCAGLLPVLFDRRRRGLQDVVASTTVVRG
jgi:uncharacterized RDD family membrane protein YckC